MQLGALPDYEMSHPSSHLPLSPSTNALDPFFRNASTPAAAQAALAASSSSSDPAGSNHLIPLPPLLPKASSSSSQFPPLQQIGTDRSGRDAYPIQWSSEGSAERSKEPLLKVLTPIFANLGSSSSSVATPLSSSGVSSVLDSATSASVSPPNFSPATRSNPPLILEIASGFGVHLEYFAQAHPEVVFLPTECDPHLVAELDKELGSLANVRPAKVLDVLEEVDWEGLLDKEGESFDGVIIDNLIHVAPPCLTGSIFKHLASTSRKHSTPFLKPQTGWIAMYGAFIDHGRFSSEGDRAFDEHLKSQSVLFGLRDISEFVVPEGRKWGFELESRVPMPRGNWLLLFRRRSAGEVPDRIDS